MLKKNLEDNERKMLQCFQMFLVFREARRGDTFPFLHKVF